MSESDSGIVSAHATANESELHGFVPVTYVQLLYQYLDDQGRDAGKLLGDPPEVSASGLGRYPVKQWQQLLNKAADSLKDPQLGLHLGATISPKNLGMLGYILLSCGTLAAALQRLLRYHRLIYDVNPMQLTEQGAQVEMRWGEEQGRPGALVDETAIAALLQFCRDICGRPDLKVNRIDFINPAPADLSPYQAFFGCDVHVSQPATRVCLPLSALNIPLRASDPALIALLEKQADELLAASAVNDGAELLQQVRQLIARQLHDKPVTADDVASELLMSSRNLHRKLVEHDSSFGELLRQTREQLARHYLQDQRLQLAEIAQLLGYSEQSAFNRGFKQWTGHTPLQYRRRGC